LPELAVRSLNATDVLDVHVTPPAPRGMM
jgi:hypothetical protein